MDDGTDDGAAWEVQVLERGVENLARLFDFDLEDLRVATLDSLQGDDVAAAGKLEDRPGSLQPWRDAGIDPERRCQFEKFGTIDEA